MLAYNAPMESDHEVPEISFTRTEKKRIISMRKGEVALFVRRNKKKPTQDDHVAISMRVFNAARRRFGK